jgi:hypothetical protein
VIYVCAETQRKRINRDLLQRLQDALPKMDERETVWRSVQGHDLRAAVTLIESQAAEIARHVNYANVQSNEALAYQKRIRDLEAECDALRAALKKIAGAGMSMYAGSSHMLNGLQDTARAALATREHGA